MAIPTQASNRYFGLDPQLTERLMDEGEKKSDETAFDRPRSFAVGGSSPAVEKVATHLATTAIKAANEHNESDSSVASLGFRGFTAGASDAATARAAARNSQASIRSFHASLHGVTPHGKTPEANFDISGSMMESSSPPSTALVPLKTQGAPGAAAAAGRVEEFLAERGHVSALLIPFIKGTGWFFSKR